jgi:conjugal transfer pilus assembly protein TraF
MSMYRLLSQPLFLVLFLSIRIPALGALPVDAHTHHTPSFFSDHTRGWHWYEQFALNDQELETSQEKLPEQIQNATSLPKSPTELIKAYREELELRLHTAWVYPTPQNIKAYQAMQKDMMDRSKVFSTVWLQTVFQNPELDHTLISPVNQQGRHIQIDMNKNRTFQAIKDLSQTWGLFFFFSNDCPYCHQFAPVVKKFSDTYQWEVIAIRIGDERYAHGNQAPEKHALQDDIEFYFPNAQNDTGLFQAWGVKVLPSLFAVNPATREAIPIAYGMTSLDEMQNRIITLLGGKR